VSLFLSFKSYDKYRSGLEIFGKIMMPGNRRRPEVFLSAGDKKKKKKKVGEGHASKPNKKKKKKIKNKKIL